MTEVERLQADQARFHQRFHETPLEETTGTGPRLRSRQPTRTEPRSPAERRERSGDDTRGTAPKRAALDPADFNPPLSSSSEGESSGETGGATSDSFNTAAEDSGSDPDQTLQDKD